MSIVHFFLLPGLLLGGAVVAAESSDHPAPGSQASFVSCPIYRDTDAGRKSGCWIATDGATGQRYDVSDSPAKPWVGRQILVEGVVSGGPDICGGVALNPVRVAILPETCPEAIIPAEGYPSKPSVMPKDVMMPIGFARPVPEGPFSKQTYQIYFDLGEDRLTYQSVETTLDRAMLYAVASDARLRVTGYADGRGIVVSGRRLKESKRLAKARADMVKRALVGLGVPSKAIKLSWNLDPAPLPSQTGMLSPSKRRVTIELEPAAIAGK